MAAKVRSDRTHGMLGSASYDREDADYVCSDGSRFRHIVTDYRNGGREARVVESIVCLPTGGRHRIEMYQTEPSLGRTRVYKRAERAHARAAELVGA